MGGCQPTIAQHLGEQGTDHLEVSGQSGQSGRYDGEWFVRTNADPARAICSGVSKPKDRQSGCVSVTPRD